MTEWDSRDQRSEQSPFEGETLGNNLVKYFIHGIPFAIFLPVLSIALEIVLLSPDLGLYSGLLLMLGLFFLVLPLFFGFLNGEIARRVWGLNPKKSVTTWYGQGFLLFIMLPFFEGLYYYVTLLVAASILIGATSAVALLIALILLDAIVSGYIGRHIAVEFEGAREGAEEFASVSDRHTICPHCQSRFVHRLAKMDSDGYVSCPHCGGRVSGQPKGPQPTDSWDSFDQ